jgi:small GTP-binding protein
VKLQIWDTCGQDVYKSLVTNFYRSSALAILCYSIDNRQSFENISNWLQELRSNSDESTKIFLIGNKSDLEYK